MIKVDSKITIDDRIIKRISKSQITALEKTAEALHTNVLQAQVMPRDTGNLQNESTFVDYTDSNIGKVSIISSTPYARRLYFHPEYNFKKNENAFAMGEWYRPWLPGGAHDSFARKTFSKIYKKEAGI